MNQEKPSPVDKLETAVEKGWTVLGLHNSYSSTSRIILFHEERNLIGKITYNVKKIPEITE